MKKEALNFFVSCMVFICLVLPGIFTSGCVDCNEDTDACYYFKKGDIVKTVVGNYKGQILGKCRGNAIKSRQCMVRFFGVEQLVTVDGLVSRDSHERNIATECVDTFEIKKVTEKEDTNGY